MAKEPRARKTRKNEKRERQVFGRLLTTQGQRKVLRRVDAWWEKWLNGYDESLREKGGVWEELASMDRIEAARRLRALRGYATAKKTWKHRISAVMKACDIITGIDTVTPLDPPAGGWKPYSLAIQIHPKLGRRD